MPNSLSLGSLFNGSGAFELAASRLGITPVWASDVEPFPIAVTRKHFPGMLHLGDINRIDGANIPPVDIITGGFCCQDLSVAGKQAGLHGERSGLFFQMIRIIREMLAATNGQSPHYLIFENVPGLLSSKQGSDFREVMDEISALGFIADPNILDSQEFKIPQRRKRVFIACINRRFYNAADFAGCPKMRDKRMEKSLASWNGETFYGIASRPHTAERKRLSEILEKDIDERYYLTAAACLGILRRVDAKGKEIPQLLRSALESQAGLVISDNAQGCQGFEPGILGRLGRKGSPELAPTIRSSMGDNKTAVAFQAGGMVRGNSASAWEEVVPTLRAETHGGDNQPGVVIPIDERNAKRQGKDNCGAGIGNNGEGAYTVTAEHQGAICLEHHPNDSRIKISKDGICQCLEARAGLGGGNAPLVMNQREYAATVSEDVANTQSASQFKGVQAVCVQGNIIGRDPEAGAMGKGANEEISYTLTDVDRHAVAYSETASDGVYSMTTGSFVQANDEQAPTLQARDFKSCPVINTPAFGLDRAAFNQGSNAQYKPQIAEESIHSLTAQGPGAVSDPHGNGFHPDYVVRRLTPTECLVLMDLPRDWCEGLENENPTAGDIAFWTEVFESHRIINNPSSKPKTEKQIRRWLKKPYSDSACYKMAGNGCVTAVAEFVLQGILNNILCNVNE